MKTLLLLVILLSSLSVRADEHDDFVHFTAHAGASFAINTAVYAFNKRALGLERTDNLIFSAVSTLMVGTVYKLLERSASDQSILNSTLQNSVGIGFSMVVIEFGDF